MDRSCQGILAVLLSLKKYPIIRYQNSSNMARRLAETIRVGVTAAIDKVRTDPRCYELNLCNCICMCYRSKLFLGNSIFKLVYFFQTRSIISLNLDQFGAGKKHRSQATSHRSLLPNTESILNIH